MKLFVVRHGETKENVSEMLQGNMDTILDQKGKEQALNLNSTLEQKQIDMVFCSPKKRTLETAILAYPKSKIIFDDRLKSRNHGEFEGKSRSEINIEEYWNIKNNKQYDQAESVGSLFGRVKDFIHDLKQNYEDKNILIVTHSGIVRVLYYYFNGIPEDGNLLGYQSVNASLEEYEI